MVMAMHATPPTGHATDAPRPAAARFGGWRWVRLLAALLVLLITALDEWLTAVLGIRPLIPAAHQALALLVRECRDWADGVTDAEIVSDPDTEVRP